MNSLDIIRHQAESYIRKAEKLNEEKSEINHHEIPDPKVLRKIGDAIYASAKAEAFSEAVKIIKEHGDVDSYEGILKRLTLLTIFIIITFFITLLSILFHF